MTTETQTSAGVSLHQQLNHLAALGFGQCEECAAIRETFKALLLEARIQDEQAESTEYLWEDQS